MTRNHFANYGVFSPQGGMQEINTGAIYEAKRAHKPDLTASNTVNIGLILIVAFAALLSDRIYHLA